MRDGKGTPRRPELMTQAYRLVKFGLTSTSECAFTKWPNLVTDYAVLMTTARIFRSRVLGNSHARF